MIENVPLMIAWLPTTEARIAKISTGHLTLSAAEKLHDVFYNMLSYRQENSYTFRKLIKALDMFVFTTTTLPGNFFQLVSKCQMSWDNEYLELRHRN